VALIGESGAGKSTLIQAARRREHAVARRCDRQRRASACAHHGHRLRQSRTRSLHGALTIREALRYAARLRTSRGRGQSRRRGGRGASSLRSGSRGARGPARDRLSGGQRKGAASRRDDRAPKHPVLDEPTTGLDPEIETRMRDSAPARKQHRAAGRHHADEDLSVCDRLVVMGRGGERVLEGR